MKVLVTGAQGFIGKNLVTYLQKRDDVDLYKYDRDSTDKELEEAIQNADFIFHLAGINRPEKTEEFYEGNVDLTKKIVDLLKKYNKETPLVISSSIQAELDNDYGKSKKEAEDYLKENYAGSIIFRFHNVFGKWCKPNYNSVVATFCYNISHDKEIQVSDPANTVELVYIDDVCEELLKVLDNPEEYKKDINYINERRIVTLQELTDLLYSFKDDMNSIYVPKTGDNFIKKLFATYVSYCELDDMVHTPKVNTDERGSFSELVRTMDSGQFSVSYSKPGVFRGNHFHHTKMERFIVIKGKAKITFRDIITDEMKEYFVDDSKLQIVTIPVGYTHSIENIGDDEMILFLWCNELFDEKHPDTYYEEVQKVKKGSK